VAGAALAVAVDADGSSSSRSGGCFLDADDAAAVLATRRRLLEVAIGWMGGSASASALISAAVVRFFVRPRDANGGFFFSEGSLRLEVLLELATPRFLEVVTAALADAGDSSDDSAAVGAATAVTGRFLDPSKSSRDVCLLRLRVRLQTDWRSGFIVLLVIVID